MIKVLIVDDSTFMRKTLRHMLSFDQEIEVVGEAGDGRDAVEKVLALKPDVVTMDIIMPGTDGLWALDELMKQRPTPVIIVSSIGVQPSEVVREAFSLGVVDVLSKPDNLQNLAAIQKELVEKIRAASRVNRVRLLEYKSLVPREKSPAQMSAHQVVIIATSAGGPASLYEVVPRFSKNFYGSVIVAQHMPPQFINSFVEHIQTMTPILSVKIAEKGDIVYSRRVLFSPTSATLEIHRTKKYAVADITDYKMRLQPDINKVITSCAEAFKSQVVLVVLSGLGDDGVRGAEIVKKYGGRVIVEDESTAGVYSGMPSSVVKSGFYDLLCPSYNIAEAVESYLNNKPYTLSNNQFMIKGIVIKNTVQYIENTCSDAAFAALSASLGESLRALVNGNIRQYNYYSGEFFYELFGKVQQQLGRQQAGILEAIAAENMKECMTVYKTALSYGGINELGAFIKMYLKNIFPGLSCEVNEGRQEQKKTECIFRSEGFKDDTVKVFAATARGWMEHLGKLAGLSSFESGAEPFRDDKGWYVRSVIKW